MRAETKVIGNRGFDSHHLAIQFGVPQFYTPGKRGCCCLHGAGTAFTPALPNAM
jgi:hypothetical protein